MKKIRFRMLGLCVICLMLLSYCDTVRADSGKCCDEMEHLTNAKCREMSILNQIHEYQNRLIMYRKMYLAYKEGDPGKDDMQEKVRKKLDGFLFKLQEGNKFDFEGDEKGEKERIQVIGLLTDKTYTKVWFEITSIEFTTHELADDASDYAIDCTAMVTMSLFHAASPVKNSRITMEVDHMKVCEPD